MLYCFRPPLTHGSEAWMLTPRALATLNGFNSRQLHRITGRSYQEEATTPSSDLLTAVRTRRHHWLGHILRMPADRLVRWAVLALGQRDGPPYQPGSILIDTPLPLTELLYFSEPRRWPIPLLSTGKPLRGATPTHHHHHHTITIIYLNNEKCNKPA